MDTMSGLIRQRCSNASISSPEIPPAGATPNDGTNLLQSWAMATNASSKKYLRFRTQRATWINLLRVSQLPRPLKHRSQTTGHCFSAADEICHHGYHAWLRKRRTCSQKAGVQRDKCHRHPQNNQVLRSVKHQQVWTAAQHRRNTNDS